MAEPVKGRQKDHEKRKKLERILKFGLNVCLCVFTNAHTVKQVECIVINRIKKHVYIYR